MVSCSWHPLWALKMRTHPVRRIGLIQHISLMVVYQDSLILKGHIDLDTITCDQQKNYQQNRLKWNKLI